MDNTAVKSPHAQPLRFRCPGCQTVLQAPAEYAGKRVKCHQCQQLLQVPGADPKAAQLLRAKAFIICICGSCKHIFKAPSGESDHTVRCPACSHEVDIPKKLGQTTQTDTFRFTCRNCQQDYCVLSKYGGKKFTCLACKQPTGIPIPAAAEPSVEELETLDVLEEPEGIEEDVPTYRLQDEPQEETAAPPEFDLSRVQTSVGRPATRGKRKSGEVSGMAKLKIPLIAIGGLVGFIVGFLVVSSLMKGGDSSTDSAIPIQSTAAIAFVEENIELLHGMKQKDVGFRFHSTVSAGDADLRELAYSLSLGEIDNIVSKVTFSNVAEGAEAYVVESVVTYTGKFTRTVQAGICIGVEAVYDEFDMQTGTEAFSKLMSLRVSDADGIELYAIGETAELLISQLNAFVAENGFVGLEAFGEMSPVLLLTLFVIGLVLILLTLFCQMAVFARAGESGWAVFIPIYREICMARIAEKPEILGVVCGVAAFIPSIGQLAYVILFCMFSIGIARAFDRGILFGLGLAFLPIIFYPILAFSGSAYD